jgi:hypothetical protein
MKVKALRGVCIGIERHMKPGDIEDVDAALATFLKGIGAVEEFTEPPPKAEAKPEPKPEPAKAGSTKEK